MGETWGQIPKPNSYQKELRSGSVFIRSPQVCAPLWPQKNTELWNPGWAMASPRRPHLTPLTSDPDWSYHPGSLLPSSVQQPLVAFRVL